MATSTTNQAKTAPKAAAKGHASAGADGAEESPPPKKKSKLLIIILALVLLLGAGGGAAWYFFLRPHPATDKEGAEKAAAHAAAAKPPVFVTMEQFTVNLQHEDSSAQYLQVGLSLKTTDTGFVEAVKQHLPEIRSRVLLLLASKKASEIATSEGKKVLVEELKHEITQPLSGGEHPVVLDDVLFTSFVIQ
jgi:flagellar FliL protein